VRAAQRHKQLKTALATDKAKLKLSPRSWLTHLPCFRDPDLLMGQEDKDTPAAESSTKTGKKNQAASPPVVDTPDGRAESQATDNSCTQFAMLAVWVAQRHEVPVERCIKLVLKRFRSSQNSDGGWSYKYKRGGGEPTQPQMICAGLLGFAVQYSVDDPILAARAAAAKKAVIQVATTVGGPTVVMQFLAARAVKKAAAAETAARKRLEEDRTHRAFEALAPHVGQPAGRFLDLPQGNLYYLWSLERVALLYNLPTIGGKDWYRWGAEQLIANQKSEGNWEKGGLPLESKVLDTCFALLFLSQANLTEGLADKLKLEAQLVKEQPPVKKEPLPTAAAPVTAPVAPPPEKTLPVEPSPAPQVKAPEAVATEPPPSVASTPPAPPNKPAADNSETWLWGAVIGGVVLAGALIALLVVVLTKMGRAETHEEEDDEEEEEARPQNKRPLRREKGKPQRGKGTRGRD
jgi:hypothetical protein